MLATETNRLKESLVLEKKRLLPSFPAIELFEAIFPDYLVGVRMQR